MSLPVSYVTYGYVYMENGTSTVPNIEVTAESITNGGSTVTSTNNEGKYAIDLKEIDSCNDGDTIKVYASRFANDYYTFTLNLSHGFKNLDIITSWFGHTHDLIIYYNSLDGYDFINSKCTRWDVNDYSLIVETFIDKEESQLLFSNIIPGATGELYSILGKPTYYDSTWQGNNTLRLVPYNDSDSNLKNMRDEKIIYVKNITNHPIRDTENINIKIEGYISGSTL